MSADTDFPSLDQRKQNQLLQMVAYLLRPAIGEIGEVVVEEIDIVVDGNEVRKKPGFLGLLFRHSKDQVIAFAEFVHEEDRKSYREEKPIADDHVLEATGPFVAAIVEAAAKSIDNSLGVSDSLSLSDDPEYINIFRTAYGTEAEGAEFKIKILAKTLHKDKDSDNAWQSLLYFAGKDDPNGLNIKHDLLRSIDPFIEQLVRNALGLAGISDLKLRSTVGYLLAKLSQNFNDFVYPQTLAAIYAYVREVVPLPFATPNFKPPKVSGHSNDNDGENLSAKLQSLHRATSVHVNRTVGGSLKGASVYSLKVTGTHDGSHKTSYTAIAKFSTIKEARDESEGLRRLQRYYSRIGKMLPPPLEVYLERDSKGLANINEKDWLNSPCISLTPDLEGSVLSEKIAEHWASPTRRVDRFLSYLDQARKFISELQDQTNDLKDSETEESHTALTAFFNSIKANDKEKSRYQLLIDSLNFPDEAWLKVSSLTHCDVDTVVPNPIHWIRQMLSDAKPVSWKNDLPPRRQRRVLIHGDFHTGNLFLGNDSNQLTVLDYDRVDIGSPEEDFARLDSSFVSFVFALQDFRDRHNWDQFAPDTLALLAGLHPKAIHTLNINNFARDLTEVLEVIRPDGLTSFFCASVAKALLIQLKTTCTLWNGQSHVLAEEGILRQDQGRNAATWLYLAFMLSRLLDPKAADESAVEWNPFDSSIEKPKVPRVDSSAS